MTKRLSLTDEGLLDPLVHTKSVEHLLTWIRDNRSIPSPHIRSQIMQHITGYRTLCAMLVHLLAAAREVPGNAEQVATLVGVLANAREAIRTNVVDEERDAGRFGYNV